MRNRPLIRRLVAREISARYRGAALGIAWIVILPLLTMLAYTFVFQFVLKARWTPNGGFAEFALYIFAGITVFNVFSETILRAPGLMLENATLIKKVVFPLEILPLVSLAVALVNAAVALVIWLGFYAFLFGMPSPSVLLAPIVLAPLCLASLGLSWFLASIGVFFRDVRQVLAPVVTMMMFITPVFFPADAVPATGRWLVMINPLTWVLEGARAVLFEGRLPDVSQWVGATAIGLAMAALGLFWFQKTRKAFADVV